MNLNISINQQFVKRLQNRLERFPWGMVLFWVCVTLSIAAGIYAYVNNIILVYGDAESHLNISKRVVSGLTAGFAQLGGIWLPLPHLLMLPFVYFDPLWRTGLAGTIVSGISYIITALTLYKLVLLVTRNKVASGFASLVFAVNPNILYMQTTPLTEMPLIAFMTLSTYFFIKYIYDETDYLSLILAAFFAFCSSLSRYDGWFLVMFEAMIIILKDIVHPKLWKKMEGKFVLFCTLAFFGVALWLLWGFVILGDPLYFTHSQFSAKSQQQSWLSHHELPAYKDLAVAVLYYIVDTISNVGLVVFFLGVVGFIMYLRNRREISRFLIITLLLVPFAFNVVALFLGQSVIFIPDITPVGYEWRLFNVRYGILMVSIIAFFIGYFFYKSSVKGKILIVSLFLFQYLLFGIGYSRTITLDDGLYGLSAAKHPEAEIWMRQHYDSGLVLLDDYARTMSVIKTNIPMQNVIYVGTKPYWEISLRHPEQYATWVIMQKNDDVWKHIYDNPAVRGDLFKYFHKVYTSPEILIFRKA